MLVEEGEVVKLPQFVEETHQYFNDANDTVCSNLKQAHQQRKLAFDKKEHGDTFQMGDRVWLYTPAVKEGCNKKVATQWRGPYTIVDKTSSVNYRIQIIAAAHQIVVHRNCLKPVFGTPELASRGSKPLRATPTRTFPTPNGGCLTYADVVKGSISSSELSAGSTTACEETASPLTQLVDDHGTRQEISSSARPQRNRQPPEHYGAPIIY